jgi:tetratricopeptide (TPR) repeat protein
VCSELSESRTSRWCVLLLLTVSAFIGRAAQAQPTVTEANVEAPEALSAARAESAYSENARELTLRARERFEAGDYEAALSEFTRAYDMLQADPRRAALLNNIAVCHERLFRYDLALRYYQRYLQEAHTDAHDRAEVEAVIRGLRDLLGKLHITSNVRAEIWIDDRALGFAPGDVEVPAGTRVVKLQASGRQPQQRELKVVARVTQTVHFELEPLPEYHGLKPAYFWAGVGLTAVAGVVGAGLGLAALAKQRENESLQDDQLLVPEDEDKKRNLGIAADVSYGATAMFAVSATVLYFLTDFRGASDHRPAADKRPNLRMAPTFTRHVARLQLTRSF